MAGSDSFHTFTIPETFAALTAPEAGLTADDVKQRLSQYGPNTLPSAKLKRWWEVLWEQVKSPLVFVLLGAALISSLLHEFVDATVIMAAVIIQVVVGFIQEYKAQTSLQALQKVIALSARVQRDGTEQVISAQELVPGDIVLLSAGDKIPSDVRLVHVADFEVNEAALTGESDAVVKNPHSTVPANATVGDRLNMAFSGTVATKGSARGVVVQTGLHTEMGGIARLIKETADEDTPLQKQLGSFAKKMSIGVVAIALGIFLFGYFFLGNVTELFSVSVAMAVSAIPEGLAIAVTIILAAGMQRILKRKALVRRLVAAETLGSTNVICTDKTGTLTEGKMQVTEILTETEDDPKELALALRIGVLCNDAKVSNPDDMVDEWQMTGNLTERALIAAAMQAGIHFRDVQKTAPRVDTIPFDSAIKYMASLHREAHGRILYIKGAPEIVLQLCQLSNERREHFERKFKRLSEKGLRIIGLAYKHAGSAKTVEEAGLDQLNFVGYVGIKDPLRPQAKQTVAECKRAGIKTVMITGDHKLTAKAIAVELGLPVDDPASLVEGHELDKMSQHELNQRVQQISVYARVTPQHKLRIVQAWQSHQMVVAMTGDGINDAPAIKAADIGVALGSGTDVAKETADIVILDDDFSTIVAAVEEGRGIFDNIKKTVLYLLSDSFTEVLLIVLTLLWGLPVPVTAAMILWVNIVNDSFPSLAMTQERKERESMMEPPRGHRNVILDTKVKTLIAVISLITGLFNVALFQFIYTNTHDLEYARTMVFLSIGIDSLFFMFSIRSLRRPLHQTNIFGNPWLILALIGGMIAQALPIYVPMLQNYFGTVALDYADWGLVFGLIVIEMTIIELCKYFFLKVDKPRPV
ncbi:MAG TPA: ATPase [Candidatus Kerfeldbacteria bacterium]|nr:ATPase [Candidatus Kerfeldbacteria bacterium]